MKSTEALLFPLRRMLREFAGFLRARDTGVQQFTITFAHRGMTGDAARHRLVACRSRCERFFDAGARAARAPRAARTDRRAAASPADQFAMPTALQADLMQRRACNRAKSSHIRSIGLRLVSASAAGSWTATGRGSSARSELDEQHRCKRRATSRNFQSVRCGCCRSPSRCSCRRCRRSLAGPERIEGGWWDGGDVQRDYYVVHTQQRRRACGFTRISASAAAGICTDSGHELLTRSCIASATSRSCAARRIRASWSAQARDLGYSALALTDECSMAGVVRAHDAAQGTAA